MVFIISAAYLGSRRNNAEEQQQQEEEGVTEDTTPVVPDFPFTDSEIDDAGARADLEFDSALTMARQWREDTMLYAVLVEYQDSIAERNGKNTYIFASPSLNQFYFTVSFDQDDTELLAYERTIYYKEDYFLPDDIEVMPMQYWATNYLEAIKKADDLGGKDIRADYAQYDVNALLVDREGLLLNWNIEYLVDDFVLYSNEINAFTGEVDDGTSDNGGNVVEEDLNGPEGELLQ